MEPLPRVSLHCPNCGAHVAEDSVHCAYCRAVLAITACPSCFGAVFKSMKFCPHCGAAVARTEVRSEQKLVCPRCEKPLAQADIAGTRIHECGQCGGLWLDAGSFQKICADREKQEKAIVYPSAGKPADLPSAQPLRRFYVPCPECGELMNQKNFAGCSGIVVDVCKPHGIWFDRQELQKIVNFIQDGGLHKAREKELDNLKAEQDRLRDMQYEKNLEAMNMGDHESLMDWRDEGSLLAVINAIQKKIKFR